MDLIEQAEEATTDSSTVSDDTHLEISPAIFRAYDIRGIVPEQISETSIELIGRAIASEALAQGISTLLLAYDGRVSSPSLSQALKKGLLGSGCNVVNLGLAPTPLLYFGTHKGGISSGVMLTASHNPANYNGIKIVFNQACLAANQIQVIRSRVEEKRLACGSGQYSELDLTTAYIEDVHSKISLKRKLKLVLDCGNAVPAMLAPRLFRKLGCEVEELYCDIDGSFPNHHPDPTQPDNLEALAKKVVSCGADFGVAFDGDGDRLGLVSNTGEFVDADKILMLLAQHIVPNYPGAAVVYDVKCSQHLARLVSSLGGVPCMHRSGHSFMKQKMEETGAPLGGEFAAHVFIKDRWYGFDDGLYAAARVAEILAAESRSANEVFSAMPRSHSTPEIKVPVDEEYKFELMDKIIAIADFPDARLIQLDGLRVEFDDGWGLIRASNTSPALLLRFEAETPERLEDLQHKFKALIHSADTNLEMRF